MQHGNEGGKEIEGMVGGKCLVIEKRGPQIINPKK
jgi:hypothetical protein